MGVADEATSQAIKLSLDGATYVLKVTGAMGKALGAFLAVFVVKKGFQRFISQSTKLKGKARLTTMLKKDKQLSLFPLSKEQLLLFKKEAKKYGILYVAVTNKTTGQTDIMCMQEDTEKLNRVLENIKYATVDVTEEKTNDKDLSEDEVIIEDATNEKTNEDNVNPSEARTKTDNRSEPSSKENNKDDKQQPEKNERKSVKKDLEDIKNEHNKKQKEKSKTNSKTKTKTKSTSKSKSKAKSK